jgi:hypothetical protein
MGVENMDEKFVEILEPVKGKNRITKIQLKDVPQGYVQVEFNGSLYWMSPTHIVVGDTIQKPFIGELKRKIIKLADQLQEVIPRTCEEWEESLRREPDPEKEINALFHISNNYKAHSLRLNESKKKEELIKLLFECSLSTKNKMLKTFKSNYLTNDESSKVIKQYYKSMT